MSEESQEISSLDFANLIGGPLNAIVEAQAKSAIATANFIKQVGFKLDKDGEIEGVNYVNFQFSRKDESGRAQDFKLSVPLLTMVPIPYITVVEGTVEFNAKITSVRENKGEATFKQNVNAEVNAGFWFVRTKVNSQTSYQQNTSESGKVERSYDMNVKVKVRNADMPRGTERILDILQEVIEEVPVTPVKGVSGTVKTFDGNNVLTLSTAKNLQLGWEVRVNDQPVGTINKIEENQVTFAPSPKVTLPAIKPGYAFEARMPKPNGTSPNGGEPTGSTILKSTGKTIADFLSTVLDSKGQLKGTGTATAAINSVKTNADDKPVVINYLNKHQPTGYQSLVDELNK